MHATENISIGKRYLVAANTNIIDSNGHNLSFDNIQDRIRTSGETKAIVIEDDVWIGSGCLILPGSFIGKGTIIGAGSVVKGKIPSYCIASGNPAIVIKQYP